MTTTATTAKPIVVGTDGSERADRAVAKAAELAAQTGRPLHIVKAHTEDVRFALPQELDAFAFEQLAVEIEATDRGAYLAAARSWAEGIDVEVHLERGNPVEVLHTVARTVDAGLIVVGNRGIDGARGLVGRSIPQLVQRNAPCDVLVVDTAA